MLRSFRPVLGTIVVAIAIACTTLAGAAEPGRERRLALVVGNAAYPAAPLTTPVNDAGLVAGALAQADFDVTAVANADRATLREAFGAFVDKVQGAGADTVVVVYLAGYGMQFDGDNFFAPTDARIARDTDVPSQALALSDLAQPLEAAPAHARILIYDLARATPYAESGLRLAAGLGIPISPDGTLTALNAAPGTVAAQGVLPYGLYAQALAEMVQTPGLPLATLFQRVRLRVTQRTNGETIPYDIGRADLPFFPSTSPAAGQPSNPSLAGMPVDLAFASVIGRDTLPAYSEFLRAFPNERLSARVRPMQAIRREELMWSESLRADTARAYWTYMRHYPRGPHFGDVRRRLAALNTALEPPPRFDIYDFTEVPAPGTGEQVAADGRDIGSASPGLPPVPPLPTALLPSAPASFDEIRPPPIVPENVVPIPPPMAPSFTTATPVGTGRVVQALVGGHGLLLSQMGEASVTLTGDGALLSKTAGSLDRGRMTLVQTHGSGTVISRVTITHDNQAATVAQTGPSGEVLTKTVVRTEADGHRISTTTLAPDRLVASWTANGDGTVTSLTRGDVPLDEQSFVLMPGLNADGLAIVVSRAQAKGLKSESPKPSSLPVLVTTATPLSSSSGASAPPAVPSPAAAGPGAPLKVPEASFPRTGSPGPAPFGSLKPEAGSTVSLPEWHPPGSVTPPPLIAGPMTAPPPRRSDTETAPAGAPTETEAERVVPKTRKLDGTGQATEGTAAAQPKTPTAAETGLSAPESGGPIGR